MKIEEARHEGRAQADAVGSSAKENAKEVAHDAASQTKHALSQMRDDAQERAGEQAQRVAGTLHNTSEQLRAMARSTDDGGLPATLVNEGAEMVDRIASRLDSGELDTVFGEIRSFARRRPGAFLLGAGAAGFVAGRVVRNLNGAAEGSEAASARERFSGYSSASPPGESAAPDAASGAWRGLDPDGAIS